MRYVLFLLLTLIPFKAYSTLDCDNVPNCLALGYSSEDVEDCPEDGYMYCPFDLNYKKCVVAKNTDCADIGFTKTDKDAWCSQIVTCKSDSSYTLCAMGTNVINVCEIGYVFYADGTCSHADDYNAGVSPTPIGVVFYVTDGGTHGKIVNLQDITYKSKYVFDPENPYNQTYNTIRWGLKSVSLAEMTSYTTATLKTALQDEKNAIFNGKEDTSVMASATNDSCEASEGTADWTKTCVSMPARAAVNFYPTSSLSADANFGAGQWWLPSIGELSYLYGFSSGGVTAGSGNSGADADASVKVKVNEALTKLGTDVATTIADLEYWSSTQMSDTSAWKLDMATGSRETRAKDYVTKMKVRLVTDF